MNNLSKLKALSLGFKRAKPIAPLKTQHQFEKLQSDNTELYKDKSNLYREL